MRGVGVIAMLLTAGPALAQHLPMISDVSISPRTGFIDPFGVATTTFHFDAVYKDADGDRFRTFEVVAQKGLREYSWPAENAAGDPRRGIRATWTIPLPSAGTYTVTFRAADKDGSATAPEPVTVRVYPWFYWAAAFAAGFWFLAAVAAWALAKAGLTEVFAAVLAWVVVAWAIPWALIVWLLRAWTNPVRYYVAAVVIGLTMVLGFVAWVWQKSSLRPRQA